MVFFPFFFCPFSLFLCCFVVLPSVTTDPRTVRTEARVCISLFFFFFPNDFWIFVGVDIIIIVVVINVIGKEARALSAVCM